MIPLDFVLDTVLNPAFVPGLVRLPPARFPYDDGEAAAMAKWTDRYAATSRKWSGCDYLEAVGGGEERKAPPPPGRRRQIHAAPGVQG